MLQDTTQARDAPVRSASVYLVIGSSDGLGRDRLQRWLLGTSLEHLLMEARAKSYVGVGVGAGAGAGAGALLHCNVVIGAGTGIHGFHGQNACSCSHQGAGKRINSLASRRGEAVLLWLASCEVRGTRCGPATVAGPFSASILGASAWNPSFRYRRPRGRRWWSGEMLVGRGRHDAESRASTEEGRIFAAAYHRLPTSPSTFISVIGQCARYQGWGKIRTWWEAAEACWVSPALGVLDTRHMYVCSP